MQLPGDDDGTRSIPPQVVTSRRTLAQDPTPERRLQGNLWQTPTHEARSLQPNNCWNELAHEFAAPNRFGQSVSLRSMSVAKLVRAGAGHNNRRSVGPNQGRRTRFREIYRHLAKSERSPPCTDRSRPTVGSHLTRRDVSSCRLPVLSRARYQFDSFLPARGPCCPNNCRLQIMSLIQSSG